MSHTDEKFIKYWTKHRAMGTFKYSLWAILFGIVSAIIMEVAFTYFWRSNDSLTLKSLTQRMLIMSILGFLYGRYSWNTSEKKFLELTKPKSSPDSETSTSSEDPVSR